MLDVTGNFNEKEDRASPFLKWAGGKRWFVANHQDLLPKKYNNYFEPFLGSGSVFFFLNPDKAFLGDTNSALIETYDAIKTNWKLVFRYLKEHHENHSCEYYYQLRSLKLKSISTRAAQFIYLNRTCWNGLYRVNKNGLFNVPIGTKTSVVFDNDCFEKISEILQKTKLYKDDFEKLINKSKKDDLIFADPPYTVRHNNNAFIKYNEKLFSWADQERLFYALTRAKKRGVKILGTNACHQSLISLYKDDFDIRVVSRNSLISSNPKTRTKYEELVITS
ncbi:MAG: DNA adenine methylase [Thermoleophilia bacterium]